ncbi:hypothetical protein [Janthinobacterium sp. 1_2014MBL_MicDiv]|uniref:hypothetical protein n=1 Tax=Janthinobacterium sp. 1_2014MBL_MicDiv TaxID=1644131 RepID=UPI0008F49CB7|nr:hypothetical protein [Janthinobacterium sp. 1_2014MBL_MicDiv]APA66795.1 hypothetical protein YQ44_02020 [Janthinobacterium sp. 1_2014MBL_MicDiv]
MGLSRLEFLPPGATQAFSGWRLALCLAGIAVLLPATVLWLVQAQETRRLEAQLAQLQPARAVRPPLSASQQRERDIELKLVATAVRQLNLPVTRLIKTVQPPRDVRIALLGLDLNAQQGQDGASALKIAAEAETPQDMLNYLAFLNQQPMFSSVYLLKHEMNANAPEHPYRFQLEAQWRQ